MANMDESDFHPKNSKTKVKRHRVTAPQYGIVNIDGLRDDYPRACNPEPPPAWWSVNLENAYRCQMAGYRDEKQYLLKRLLRAVEKWSQSGLIKKLVRWDGLFYYFSNHRECPNLKTDDIKRAFLREAITFENTGYVDKDLVWAPIITEQAQKFNKACDEIMSTIRKPKKAKRSRSKAGPSKANRTKHEKTVTFGIKDKDLVPEDGVLTDEKKNKPINAEKTKKPKENRKKSTQNKSPGTKETIGDVILQKKKNGKENVTKNAHVLKQHDAESTKPLDKQEVYTPGLPTIKESHFKFKKCGKSLSASNIRRSESQIGKECKQPIKRKKSPVQSSTSAVLKPKIDLKPSIPVTARVAAAKPIKSSYKLQ